jgi:hypothetical protein
MPAVRAKSQTPNVQMPKKLQTMKIKHNFEPFRFGFVWSLGFGVWDFSYARNC